MRAPKYGLLLLGFLGCGNAAVIAPEPLGVVDTSPGNGSLVPPGETAIAVLFSQDVDPTTLVMGATLEEVTAGGAPVQGVKMTLKTYAKDTFVASYAVDPLTQAEDFRLTVKSTVVRAVSGATLRADFVRSFATSGP